MRGMKRGARSERHGVNTPLNDPAPRAHTCSMQNAGKQRSARSSGGKAVPTFRVVIVYEDFRTAAQAKRAYDFLAANLTHEWQVTSQMWKFELLRIPELREMAANDAAKANLIIVSCHGDEELPAGVTDWIEMWQGEKGEPVALVALFDRPPEQAEHARATQACLERVAKRGHMEFFTWPEIGLAQQSRRGSLVLDHRSDIFGGPLLPLVEVESRKMGFSYRSISG